MKFSNLTSEKKSLFIAWASFRNVVAATIASAMPLEVIYCLKIFSNKGRAFYLMNSALESLVLNQFISL